MIKKIIARIVNYYNFKETRDALNKLSDRELKDIGIDRSMITSVAMQFTEKSPS